MRTLRIYSLLLATTFIKSAIGEGTKKLMILDNLGAVMPPSQSNPGASAPAGDAVILTDVLGRDRSINIFAGLTRDINTVDNRLSNGGLNTTILVPVNSAITGLPRKPWESNEDYHKLGADAYEGAMGEDRAHANLRRFVEEHIVPASPWKEGAKVATLAGSHVWWEAKDGKRFVGIYRYLHLHI